jgi:hypothetical protein
MIVKALRDWPFSRVALVGVGWLAGAVLVAALWLFWLFRPTFEGASGSAGIGAVSVGISGLALMIPVLPPIVLFLAWLMVRWRR